MTTIESEYVRLKALADAATPGPWTSDQARRAGFAIESKYKAGWWVVDFMDHDAEFGSVKRPCDAAFIAAAHDMIALIDKLMAERGKYADLRATGWTMAADRVAAWHKQGDWDADTCIGLEHEFRARAILAKMETK